MVNSFWNQQDFGTVGQQHQDLLHALLESPLQWFLFGKSYFYCLDIRQSEWFGFSEGTQEVLGIPPSEMSLERLLSRVHPDDLPIVLAFEKEVLAFFSQLLPKQVFRIKARYDYRVRHAFGHYIRILHQVVTLETDDGGLPLKILGIHSDISSLKREGQPELSFIGMEGLPTYDQGQVTETNSFLNKEKQFSAREKEILQMLMEGRKSAQIAGALGISNKTVSTHRRNMLAKCKVSNTTGLIHTAVRNGWI